MCFDAYTVFVKINHWTFGVNQKICFFNDNSYFTFLVLKSICLYKVGPMHYLYLGQQWSETRLFIFYMMLYPMHYLSPVLVVY